MTIYPLPPQELDDTTLAKNIKAIAQTLVNVHHNIIDGLNMSWEAEGIPLPPKNVDDEYSQYARTCAANYDMLVKMGLACIKECIHRWHEPMPEGVNYKYPEAIWWADKNRPELPIICRKEENCFCLKSQPCQQQEPTPFPLYNSIDEMSACWVISVKYNEKRELIQETNIIESYRAFYKAQLAKRMHRKELYEHPIWGKGYSLVEELSGSWCELKKISSDGSHSTVGDYRKNLRVYNKSITPTWTRRPRPSWLGELK